MSSQQRAESQELPATLPEVVFDTTDASFPGKAANYGKKVRRLLESHGVSDFVVARKQDGDLLKVVVIPGMSELTEDQATAHPLGLDSLDARGALAARSNGPDIEKVATASALKPPGAHRARRT